MRDLAQITMPRRAALTINNLAALGYYVACINAGVAVDGDVLRVAVKSAINSITNASGNATGEEIQEAFKVLALVPVRDGDNISAASIFTTRDGFVSDGS